MIPRTRQTQVNTAMKIADLIKYSGKIIFDKKNPAGTPRKVLDISLVKIFGWKPNYSLECALSKTYKKKFIDINNNTMKIFEKIFMNFINSKN